MKKKACKLRLSPSDFRVGFELEFKSKPLRKKFGDPCLLEGSDGKSKTPIPLPCKSLKKVGEIGCDGHLWEFRSRPVCYTKAKGYLMKAFRVLEYYEADTTRRCGLHVNISCKRSDLHDHLDPIGLTRRLDPPRLAKLFGRRTLPTCESPKNSKPFAVFSFYASKLGEEDRHMAINLIPYGDEPTKKSRVEFRFLGGKDYHRKKDLCFHVLDLIIESMSRSYRR
jgi:hypothetical protein